VQQTKLTKLPSIIVQPSEKAVQRTELIVVQRIQGMEQLQDVHWIPSARVPRTAVHRIDVEAAAFQQIRRDGPAGTLTHRQVDRLGCLTRRQVDRLGSLTRRQVDRLGSLTRRQVDWLGSLTRRQVDWLGSRFAQAQPDEIHLPGSLRLWWILVKGWTLT